MTEFFGGIMQVSKIKDQSGFTLVELMVVVAIIGVLSAVAVPNFQKYQAKSRTSEAKLHLSAIFTAMQSFYADFDTYATCLQFAGYNPANESLSRYYAVGFKAATIPNIATINGAAGCPTAPGSTFQWAAGRQLGSKAPAAVGHLPDTTLTEDNFIAGAAGIVDKNFTDASSSSAFTINDVKRLIQVRAGY
jgi:type IV pilus assembly protein PilA